MSELKKRKERWRIIEQRVLEELKDVPTYEGLTVKELAGKVDMPEPTARWHLELLERSGAVKSMYIGRTRLYKLLRNEKRE
ncbi:MAG: winged helix-turn-helix domain-containing protein [Candidatus Bathyarchaeota archaeon]|nr:winged helix-turn-helix domain-containing protein [Candidatus Bathyarchaeota archaeon]MDH5595211.1 winged helix-turn-helix domain-containing protein [Candidatus Bathyarchaeota archaeon]